VLPISRRIAALSLATLAACASSAVSQALPAPGPALARVVVLATGGTIAGVQPKEGEAGYVPGSLSVEALLAAAPGLETLAAIRGEQVASIGSQEMNDFVWIKLARRAAELLAREDVDGIVVTHGTDTLEETAYFLQLVLPGDKPVVLVGAMRPSTELGAEGPSNLHAALSIAASPESRGRGVLVVANDTVHAARDVRKSHTTAVQAFVSVHRGPVAEAVKGTKTRWFLPPAATAPKRTFPIAGLDALPRVDVVTAHQDADGALVRAAVAAGAKGIVLAGVGDGNASREMLEALAEAAKGGVVVVRSTRVGSGIVRRNIEVDDDALGFVASLELSPHKARVLLRLALTRTRDVGEIQRIFEES
jgi:L-asparaginase